MISYNSYMLWIEHYLWIYSFMYLWTYLRREIRKLNLLIPEA